MELKKDVFQRPLGSAPFDLVQNMAVSFATAPLLANDSNASSSLFCDFPCFIFDNSPYY